MQKKLVSIQKYEACYQHTSETMINYVIKASCANCQNYELVLIQNQFKGFRGTRIASRT